MAFNKGQGRGNGNGGQSGKGIGIGGQSGKGNGIGDQSGKDNGSGGQSRKGGENGGQSGKGNGSGDQSGKGNVSGGQSSGHISLSMVQLDDVPVIEQEDDGEGSSSGPKELDPNKLWFTNNIVARAITNSIQKYYNEPWRNWSETDQSTKDQWFKLFKRSFTWRPELEDMVRKGFDDKGAKRLKDLAYWVTTKKKNSKPVWMPQTVHEELLKRREDGKFKEKSAQAKKNKRAGGTNKLVNPGHCQGSVSTVEVAERMAVEQGKIPLAADVYLRTHSRQLPDNETMICCEKSQAILDNYEEMINDYKQKGVAKDPNEVYFDVVGGRKKGLVPGLGSASDFYYRKSRNSKNMSSSSFTPSLVSQLSSQVQQSEEKMSERLAQLESQQSDYEKQQALWEEERREYQKERIEAQKEREHERKMFHDALGLMKEQMLEYGKLMKCKDLTPFQRDPRDPSSGGAPCQS